MKDGKVIQAKFAFKYDRQNLIVEQASAPIQNQSWKLKNEVSICTLLTAATVQSVLKQSDNVSVFESITQKIKPKKH
jgi:hypothetical protein